LAFFSYYEIITHASPNKNILTFIRQSPYTIYTGGAGGWYNEIGKEIENRSKHSEGSAVFRVFDPDKTSEEGTPTRSVSARNLMMVLNNNHSFGFVQEDVLGRYNLGKDEINIIGSLYPERLHIFYRVGFFGTHTESEITPTLSLRSSPEIINLFKTARVRISVMEGKRGDHPLAKKVLRLCRLEPKAIKYCTIQLTFEKLLKGELDVAFIMAGAPLTKLTQSFDSSLGMMSIDPELVSQLNNTYHYLHLLPVDLDLYFLLQ
jgi:TRAP-type uncharacterized transport system substrate-binding protein